MSQLEIIKLKISCLFIHSGKQQKSCLDLKFCDSDIESDWYSVILLQIDISYYLTYFSQFHDLLLMNESSVLGHLQQQLTTLVYAGFDKNDSSEEEYDNHIVLGHTSLAWAEPGSVVLEAGPGFSYDYNYILLNIANKRWQW